jgi:hypothetical protein
MGCRRLVELRLGEEQRAALALDVEPVCPLLGTTEGQPEQSELVGGLTVEHMQPCLPRGSEVLLEDPPAAVREPGDVHHVYYHLPLELSTAYYLPEDGQHIGLTAARPAYYLPHRCFLLTVHHALLTARLKHPSTSALLSLNLTFCRLRKAISTPFWISFGLRALRTGASGVANFA